MKRTPTSTSTGGSDVAHSQRRTRELRRTAAAYAALVRVPNLFTAPPDVIAGAALAVAVGGTVSLPAAAGVAGASMLLYAGGTTLNDYVDAPVDAAERPERPIPSGRIARPAAGLLGVTLLGSGIVVAAALAGVTAGIGATAVALAVVSYDGVLKGSPAGFVAMGVTRGLNVLFGMTATTVSLISLPLWVFGVPLVVAAYIAGVTGMAAQEATGATRRSVVIAGVGAGIAGLGTIALHTMSPLATHSLAAGIGIILAGGFLVTAGQALGRAYRTPSPETVGPVVGTCVLALVVVDAAIASIAGVRWALTALAFVVPAVGLSQLFDVS
ncbi:UbiA family prenyltransferase [Haloarcula amylovorans]|uniref:UbiA family prenyltransferase n=1 Tax=Haloarcula amylovorans TaxID=2562280 RepID=UPI003744AF20